ncbi:hypothetical protein P5673_028728 [Acropora cervicornis]|uniref:Uncharacterized protein n=1 Tax=Acropora cervicornis TaxID=6130 RepID=A0AAD9PWT1_ACRCE|nr:hypothetical protein P5673_028728 [Acropora cervicornis]
MAARERSVPKVDYKELNALSSVVLFNTSTRKVKGRKIYNVERIIERRKAKYRPPKPREERLQEAAYHFAGRILSALKNSAISPFYVYIHLDHDFERFTALPEHWWYYLDEHGEGRAVDFPIKIKPLLTWSPAHHIKRADAFTLPFQKIGKPVPQKSVFVQCLCKVHQNPKRTWNCA